MSRKTYRKTTQPASRFSWPVLTAVAAVILIIAGGAMVLFAPDPVAETSPEVTGAPRLVVAQPEIDEGYIKLDKTIETTFHLKNVGDRPLKILGEPQVELVEGC